jgi:hypothetical protein
MSKKNLLLDKMRMAQWLLLSVVLYLLSTLLASMHGATDAGLYPRLQTVMWKAAGLNLSAFVGYWIDRRAFRLRIDSASPAGEHIRRAIIIGASMLAFGLSL